MNNAPSPAFQIVEDGSVTTPLGFKACGFHSGLKRSKRHDLGAIYCEVPAAAAGVYTTNIFRAAPLKVTQESIAQEGKLQAVIVNSGNANACTGQQGEEDAYRMRTVAANALDIAEQYVGVASTGVIGELLPMEKIEQGIALIPGKLATDGGEDFCKAILTTDLVKKSICVKLEIDGETVHIAGAAKGSGMIEPNMATMLGFITTDATIETNELEQLLKQVTDKTFNMITVDGDTSTNDMAVVMASGLVKHTPLQPSHPQWSAFVEAFHYVAMILAQAIARDGEGASKLVEVSVAGAETDEDAGAVAKTVIGSSLVKTAIFGSDANWGRIIAAIGRAGVYVNPETVDISIGELAMMIESRPVAFDEEAAAEYLKEDTIRISIDLHCGPGRATAWGCDLTYEYVRINAAYRT